MATEEVSLFDDIPDTNVDEPCRILHFEDVDISKNQMVEFSVQTNLLALLEQKQLGQPLLLLRLHFDFGEVSKSCLICLELILDEVVTLNHLSEIVEEFQNFVNHFNFCLNRVNHCHLGSDVDATVGVCFIQIPNFLISDSVDSFQCFIELFSEVWSFREDLLCAHVDKIRLIS